MNQFDIDYGDVDDIITEEVYDDNISLGYRKQGNL